MQKRLSTLVYLHKIQLVGEDWDLPVAAQHIYWRNVRISCFIRNRIVWGRTEHQLSKLSLLLANRDYMSSWPACSHRNSTKRVEGAPHRATTRQTTALTHAASWPSNTTGTRSWVVKMKQYLEQRCRHNQRITSYPLLACQKFCDRTMKQATGSLWCMTRRKTSAVAQVSAAFG